MAEAPSISTCVHHWILESPDGRSTVSGTCKLCGQTRFDFATGYEWYWSQADDHTDNNDLFITPRRVDWVKPL